MSLLNPTHPANVFRFCPRCGTRSLGYDNEKRFNCSSCNFVYYLNAATAVAVIVRLPDGQIILTQRRFEPAAGKYDLPGGFVDMGERAEIAAIREVKEEINIDLRVEKLEFLASFPNTYEYKGICYYTCDIAFVAHYDGPAIFEANDDVQKVMIVQPSQIDFDIISFDSIRNILRLYIEKIG
ncbi:MAG: NUDIX domain-containing protein [Bacteroidales bacterium]|nr:NUDIX domain-containing protein [Bacteroidales bacterium]